MSKKISVCLSFDFDAISIWVGPKRTRSPNLISRGEFGARVGAERILRLLSDENIPTTWFIPGHTIDTFPEICREIADGGHEVGYHGYCHEGPSSKRPLEEERKILLRSIECIERISGKAPVGHRLPGGNLGERWTRLLIEHGIRYDSSMAPNDFAPTYHRLGDVPNTEEPYEFGAEVDLVILPFDWNMDDAPYFSYEPGSGRPGLRSPAEVLEIWKDEFDYLYQRIGEGVYVLTMHPQTTGKGSRMLMLERLIAHMKRHENIEFSTLATVAEEFRANQPIGG
jgi:peptidoglycan/xylan/chitin deacetylase (PgdA/CDA1 family)